MTDRALLHKSQLDQFLAYLNEQKIDHRPGKGEWEARQVRVGSQWLVIHENNRKEHLSIPAGIARLVREWIKSRRKGAMP